MRMTVKGRIVIPDYLMKYLKSNEVFVCREFNTGEIYITNEEPYIKKEKSDVLLSKCTIRSQNRLVLPKCALNAVGINGKAEVSLEMQKFLQPNSSTEYCKIYFRLVKNG